MAGYAILIHSPYFILHTYASCPFATLQVAVQYAASEQSVLLRLRTDNFMKRGANLTFLSAFPGEAEYLFPPLTYLKPKGAPQTLLVDAAAFVVVDVEPVFPS